jgi:hypothetical protein
MKTLSGFPGPVLLCLLAHTSWQDTISDGLRALLGR